MASIQEFAASIKSKYPQYQQVPDEDLVKKVVAKYPQYADRITAQAQPTAPEIETKSALFPRTAQGSETGAGYPRQVANAGADLLSLAGRGVAAAFDKDRGYKESLTDTKGGNFASQIVRDPGTMGALITAPVAGPALAGIKGAGVLANIGKSAISGAAQGVGSAAARQVENVGAGRGVDIGSAAGEVALSAVVPGALTGAAAAAKSGLQGAGKKIMESAIKPAKKLTQGRGSKFDVKNVFGLNVDSPKGLQAMDDKIAALHSELNDKYGKELAAQKGGVFNAGQAMKEAMQKVQDRINKGGLTPEEEAGIRHGAESWAEYLGNSQFIKNLSANSGYSLPAGSMTPDAAVAIRKAVQKAAKYDARDLKAVKGAELFAQDFQQAMNDQLAKKFPGVRKLDAEFAKLHPIEKAVEEATNRTNKNYGISLLDLAAVGGAGIGASQGGAEGGLGGGLATLALTRGIRSPSAASALYRAGDKVSGPARGKAAKAATATIKTLANRGAAQNFREKDKE